MSVSVPAWLVLASRVVGLDIFRSITFDRFFFFFSNPTAVTKMLRPGVPSLVNKYKCISISINIGYCFDLP